MILVEFKGDEIEFPFSMSGDEIQDVLGAIASSATDTSEIMLTLAAGDMADPMAGLVGIATGSEDNASRVEAMLTYRPKTAAGQRAMRRIGQDLASMAEETALDKLSKQGPPGKPGKEGEKGKRGEKGERGGKGSKGDDGYGWIGPQGKAGSTYLTGVATLDFGSGTSDSGDMIKTKVVTGVSGITATSIVLVQVRIEATADHGTDDLLIDPIEVTAKDIIAGTGFTIEGRMLNARALGAYKINWILF